MGIWYMDNSTGDYSRMSSFSKKLTKADLRNLFNVSNSTILEWVYEGMPCISRNTRFADSLDVSVDPHALRYFIQEKHPEFADKLNGIK